MLLEVFENKLKGMELLLIWLPHSSLSLPPPQKIIMPVAIRSSRGWDQGSGCHRLGGGPGQEIRGTHAPYAQLNEPSASCAPHAKLRNL